MGGCDCPPGICDACRRLGATVAAIQEATVLCRECVNDYAVGDSPYCAMCAGWLGYDV
jgi:hypothetical protein